MTSTPAPARKAASATADPIDPKRGARATPDVGAQAGV
jgi:hypothetical protein